MGEGCIPGEAGDDGWATPGVTGGRRGARPGRPGGDGTAPFEEEFLDPGHPLVAALSAARLGLAALVRADGGGEGGVRCSGDWSAVFADLPASMFAGVWRELAALSATVSAAQSALVQEAESRDLPRAVGERSMTGWLQRAGRLTRGEAIREHGEARALAQAPAVASGLAAGRFSRRVAGLLSETLTVIAGLPGVDEKTYREAEDVSLRLATQLDAVALGRALQQLREALTTTPDEDSPEDAAAAALQATRTWRERFLHVNTETGRITGRMPVGMAQALQTALDALAAHPHAPLPAETLAAAEAVGARVWVDHVESCPADAAVSVAGAAADPAHADGAGVETGPTEPETSCHCPWRVEWPLICTCGHAECGSTCEGHTAVPTETAGPRVADADESPSQVSEQLRTYRHVHAPGCLLAQQAEPGHEESGHPLLRRTRAQSQADALLELARLGLDAQLLPTQDAAPPHVVLHATPADLDRSLPQATFPDGTVAPPTTVAMVCCDAVVTPVLFDARGRVLAVGKHQSTWPRHLRRAVAARDRRCAFPGCETVPALCHVHHMRHFSAGGRTSVDNGCLLCPLHHALVHDLHWQAQLNADNHRPEFRPPSWVDARRRWRQHPRFQLEHLRRTGQQPPPVARDPRRDPSRRPSWEARDRDSHDGERRAS